MARRLIIHTCEKCFHYTFTGLKELGLCTLSNRRVTDEEEREIPDWCELPEDYDD